jgi:predicted secreted protein
VPRSRSLTALVAAAGLALSGLVVAAPATAQPVAAAVSAKVDNTATLTILPAQIRLIPGESVTVRLDTNLTTGYSWSYRVSGKRKAVRVVQKKAAAPAPGALIGAPTTTDWVVTANKTGTAVVRITTTPPGGGTAQTVGKLTVIVSR